MENLLKPPKLQMLCAEDGVDLSYYTVGSGPGFIVIPGAIRGLSGPYPSSVTETQNSPPSRTHNNVDLPYDAQFCLDVLKTDLTDLFALTRHTRATSLFGVSSSALLVLAACIHHPTDVANPFIEKAIIFDPPLIVSSPLAPRDILPDLRSIRRYEAEIAAGKTTSALVTAMRIVQLGPGWLHVCPDFIIRFLAGLIMSAEAREQDRRMEAGEDDEGAVTIEMLAPVLRYDFALVQAMVADARGFNRVAEGRRVLLVGGGESPEYMRFAMGGLADAVREGGFEAGMEWKEIRAVGHELFENKKRNGRVELVVEAVREFLARP